MTKVTVKRIPNKINKILVIKWHLKKKKEKKRRKNRKKNTDKREILSTKIPFNKMSDDEKFIGDKFIHCFKSAWKTTPYEAGGHMFCLSVYIYTRRANTSVAWHVIIKWILTRKFHCILSDLSIYLSIYQNVD